MMSDMEYVKRCRVHDDCSMLQAQMCAARCSGLRGSLCVGTAVVLKLFMFARTLIVSNHGLCP